MTFMTDLLKEYIEVPGGIGFQDMCMALMAAMHPPTYVHSKNIAALTRFMAERLVDTNPELFIGLAGAETESEVGEKKEEILDFAYRAALMHDVGKLFILEPIMTYGRNLLETEWDIIRAHTIAGASLLANFEETREFAEVAMGHHLWYDGSRGYPEEFNLSKASHGTLVSLVEAADCLDAATDSIGRSYKRGKNLEDVLGELRDGSGTRYAPFVAELFWDPELYLELEKLLPKWRNKNYRETYKLLKSL